MTPVPILLYHSIAETASAGYRPWCVHPRDLDAHLHVVSGLGFTPLTVSGFVDARSTGTLPDKPCLITFDDGRADFVDHAMPVLESHRMPATMYVVSGSVGGTSSWLRIEDESNQPVMNWDDLRSLGTAGIEVGAHSETHPELDVVRPRQLTSEIVTSRSRLSEGLGHAVRSFAYPHGYHDDRVVQAVRAAGYDSACAVKDRWSHDADDQLALARMFVWDTTSEHDLRRLLLSAPRTAPHDRLHDRVLRSAWRCVRKTRHHARRLTANSSVGNSAS